MSRYSLSDIAIGDTIVIECIYAHTEHKVNAIVGDMVKFSPEHEMYGKWTGAKNIKAVVKGPKETPEILTNLPERLPFFKALLAKLT